MKKTFVALFALTALLAQSAFATCPCQKNLNPCDKPTPCQEERVKPCEKQKCEGVDWLTMENLADYAQRMNLDENQKCEAMNAINKFRAKTEGLENAMGDCASKCECRAYKKALHELDCDMKQILTSCQMDGYRSVKRDVKNNVRCNYKCFSNPFARCASCDSDCD